MAAVLIFNQFYENRFGFFWFFVITKNRIFIPKFEEFRYDQFLDLSSDLDRRH